MIGQNDVDLKKRQTHVSHKFNHRLRIVLVYSTDLILFFMLCLIVLILP
jgi:hypothetical protein